MGIEEEEEEGEEEGEEEEDGVSVRGGALQGAPQESLQGGNLVASPTACCRVLWRRRLRKSLLGSLQ